MNVLMVGQSELERSQLRDTLHEVIELTQIVNTGTYEETLEVCPLSGPGIVLPDISLPDGSGTDLLQAIKEKNPGLGVVVLTNHPTTKSEQVCLESGADDFPDIPNLPRQ